MLRCNGYLEGNVLVSLKLRSILVLVVGGVLGITVTFGAAMLADRPAAEGRSAEAALSQEDVDLLAEVIKRVRREYVETVDDRTLVESAIRGMVGELDNHSRYLDENEYDDIRISTTGSYSGVGLDVTLENGRVTVVSPLDGAPAARAGILPGDVVVAVDDIEVTEDNAETTVNRMRGQPGTDVRLAVERDGAAGTLEFELTRADIRVQTVRAEYLGDGFAYVRLTTFSNDTARDLDRAARRLQREAGGSLRGLVLDLRNNPGGVLDAAIEVADLFIDDGLIVRGSGRGHQAHFEQTARPGDALENVPLAVLVNAGSASASEIVAGAIKDHGRGKLVGERTYGKGSVQTVMPLGRGSAIKLTTSHYITPSGRSINGLGIKPDVVVYNTNPQARFRAAGGAESITDDAQLKSALDTIGYDAIALSRAP